jgi:ligand-binding sensor domain-containing protein/two-component sensor histidine kinase
MFSKRPILVILFCTLCSFSKAQQVNFIKYSVYDGLVANPVRCIYQDSKGFLWIGTFDGLSRYDGYKFTSFTTANGLSHNFINAIIEIDGKLLIAENNGATDVIQNNITIQKGYKAASPVNIFGMHNNRLLLSTDANGFLEYKNDSLIAPIQPAIEAPIGDFISLNDTLLLSTGMESYLFLHKNDFSVQASLENPRLYFFSLMQDSKKRIWACTSAGLQLLQIESGNKPRITFTSLPATFNFSPLNNSQITSIVEEQDGSFWIGTSKGLVHLLPNGNFTVYTEKDGLPSSNISSLYFDREKNLWIGTPLGLAKWVSTTNIVFFNAESGVFKNDVSDISSSDDQKIYLKTGHGLQELDFATKEFKNINAPGSHYPVAVTGTSPLLIYYDDQLGVLDNKKNRLVPLTRLDSAIPGILSALKHPSGTIFFVTFYGVYAVHNRSVKKILPYRIICMAMDKSGDMWVGTWQDGLFRIHIKNSEERMYDITDMTPRIKELRIRGLYVDSKNNTWVGTRYNGAFCFTPKANDSFEVQHYTRRSGLMSDWVISFAETKTNDIWVGTYLGLDKLIKESSGYRIFNFSKAVNFFAEIRKIIPIKDHWICVSNAGIAIFKDEDLHQATPLPANIFSTSLGLLENEITLYSPLESVSLKPFQNAARFEFGALSFINERQILYSYRLKGSSDTTWSKPENIHEASYASLSPGEYTFEVKTIGWNGEYGTPASFSFFISTPFWKQWWFIALCIFAVAAFFYALYRYRINQLLRLQTVRNSIATDLHDDIGSSLTNISILSELSSKNIYEPDKAQSFLHRISEEVQTSSQAMDDIIWSVNSRNDSLQETMARMRRYAAELFDNSDIDCHLQLDENAGDKKLSMEQRRDVYLIYKEALTNIHKHADAKNVWINANQNQNHLTMQIKDDGEGFSTSSVTHRNGLKNLRSRVEKWNGKIQIASETGKGTRIDIKIPLKE